MTSVKNASRTSSQKLIKPKLELPPVEWRSFTPGPIVGVDEVGRGCLAGPVFAAAVIFQSDKYILEVTDSKLISESRREQLSEFILSEHLVGIGSASVEEIDQINILQASFLAMRRAIESLNLQTGHVLVDGHMKIPHLKGFMQTPIVKGDLRAAPISAASIVAKVARDRLMKELGVSYPEYGFEVHKGYSTAKHKASIERIGPCSIHRKTFAGVKEHLLR